MTRALCLLVLLSACGGRTDTAEDRCRAQAYRDPAVKDLVELSNTQQQQVRGPALIQLDHLVANEVRRCLGGQGLAPRGGVESPNPS